MSAAVRPIHVPGTAALEWLRDRVQSALDAWGREWVNGYTAGSAAVQVSAISHAPRSLAYEYERVSAKTASVWFRSNEAERLAMSCAVLGDELTPLASGTDEWVVGIVDCAWLARNQTLAEALLGRPVLADYPATLTALPDRLFRPLSAAVLIGCEALGLLAIADESVWRSMPPMRRAPDDLDPLVPLDQAICDSQVSLEAILGGAEVDLSRLVDLRCGDVLVLPQLLSEPLTVTCADTAIARAGLGQRNGLISIQLSSRMS
ncbi:flagellar motor switch/type III secretory pathway protein FliN [Povalibacter uvarum]|uniref:Flagellar motor switch/type III secretory pathway protein FliN n=1 Tax=Povalibacter uvarum TaxID=732238 RepID=A0A841HFG3_9GAMM|nr:FliM/FliN family flagellar motor switch protein [Povalibacter uvarum]MBB6091179.1 flagellar motor switch/type III secretory pathway protein FliN [Povalibacter uvarum]